MCCVGVDVVEDGGLVAYFGGNYVRPCLFFEWLCGCDLMVEALRGVMVPGEGLADGEWVVVGSADDDGNVVFCEFTKGSCGDGDTVLGEDERVDEVEGEGFGRVGSCGDSEGTSGCSHMPGFGRVGCQFHDSSDHGCLPSTFRWWGVMLCSPSIVETEICGSMLLLWAGRRVTCSPEWLLPEEEKVAIRQTVGVLL